MALGFHSRRHSKRRRRCLPRASLSRTDAVRRGANSVRQRRARVAAAPTVEPSCVSGARLGQPDPWGARHHFAGLLADDSSTFSGAIHSVSWNERSPFVRSLVDGSGAFLTY